MSQRELEIKVDSFRRIPNPYKDGPNSISQMYTAICDVKNIPEELLNWMETNPRKQNIRSGVAKKIKTSLVESKNFSSSKPGPSAFGPGCYLQQL